MIYTITELNSFNESAFEEILGPIFENTPQIARLAWLYHPFETGSDLFQCMASIVRNLKAEEKLALIQAHPDLGTKAKMADASVKEQAGVGLDRLNSEEFARFATLNQAYRDKFSFPFIIAVKDQTKASILSAFEARLQNDTPQEVETAITQIIRIAELRLVDILKKE